MPGILVLVLKDLYVLCLKALGAVGDVKLHRLAFLQAPESIRLDSGEMHENISAVAAADETISFCVIEPFHGSLFHYFVPVFLFEFPVARSTAVCEIGDAKGGTCSKIAGKSH
jgi:hypothetical protein